MLKTDQINAIAQEVSRSHLGKKTVVRVLSQPTIDSQGKEALQITIVIEPKSVAKLSGEQVVDTLFDLQKRLPKEGEDRFPIIEYATPDELA